MHALLIAAFAVSTAVAQVPGGSTGPAATPPPPAPAPMVEAPPPAPAAAPAPAEVNTKESLITSEGDGKWAMIGVSTAVGLGYYGWSLPSAFNLGGTQFAGAYMLTGAASFFVPFALTLNNSVTWGQTNMFYGGATHGPGHAALVVALVNSSGLTFQTSALVGLLGGGLEIAGGLMWASYTNMTAGTAHAIIVASDTGVGAGLALSIIAGASVSLSTFQLPAGLMLVGAAGGAYGGSVLGQMLHLTWGDAEFLWLSTLLGTYVPLPFITWASPSDIRAYAVPMLLGMGGGGVAGYFLLQGLHLELGQALLIDLGTFAGALVGAGSSLILGATSDFRIALTATMIGAAAGYAISYVAMKNQAPPKKMGATMQVTFNPMALADVLPEKTPLTSMTTRRGEPRPPAFALVGSF